MKIEKSTEIHEKFQPIMNIIAPFSGEDVVVYRRENKWCIGRVQDCESKSTPKQIVLSDTIPGAPNFTYGELIHSDIALKHNIDNTPNVTQWKNLEILAQKVLQPIREQFGPVIISSGFRCPELNKKCDGSTSSHHMHGYAVDIQFSLQNQKKNVFDLFDVFDWIKRRLKFTEMIAEYFPDGWIHISLDSAGDPIGIINTSGVMMLKNKKPGYTRIPNYNSINDLKNLIGGK